MGESWSDLVAVEFLNEYGLVPVGDENPFAVGAVRHRRQGGGDPQLRHEHQPAQLLGRRLRLRVQPGRLHRRTQVHADGEIWTRDQLRHPPGADRGVQRAFPADDLALQRACIDGRDARRRVPGQPALGPARVRRLAADGERGGEHGRRPRRDARGRPDPLRRRAIRTCSGTRSPRRGLGTFAASTAPNDFDPTPSFESAHADNADGDASRPPARRGLVRCSSSSAATRRATADRGHRPGHGAGRHVQDRPGHVRVRRRGNGFGPKRFTFSFNPGQVRDLPVNMSPQHRLER